MNKSQKAISRDRRAWTAIAIVFALVAALGVVRLFEGSGDAASVLIPALFAGLSWYMRRWTGGRHSTGKGKK